MSLPIDGTVGRALIDIAPWTEQALLIGVSSARFAFAFMLVPLFSPTIIPATVRNSLIVAFGLIALNMDPGIAPNQLTASGWLWLYGKEAIAGGVIGFFFGTMLWAMGAAGEIIDTKVGATIGQLVDPMSGLQQSLTSVLLSRFAHVIFVSAGGLTLLIGTIMSSYIVWPLGSGDVRFNMAAVTLFEKEFGMFFAYAFIFAAPVLIILYVIDMGLGLLNRFAQQFNVFALAMPIKAAASIFVLIIILPFIAQQVINDMVSRPNAASRTLGLVGDAERSPPPLQNSPSQAPVLPRKNSGTTP